MSICLWVGPNCCSCWHNRDGVPKRGDICLHSGVLGRRLVRSSNERSKIARRTEIKQAHNTSRLSRECLPLARLHQPHGTLAMGCRARRRLRHRRLTNDSVLASMVQCSQYPCSPPSELRRLGRTCPHPQFVTSAWSPAFGPSECWASLDTCQSGSSGHRRVLGARLGSGQGHSRVRSAVGLLTASPLHLSSLAQIGPSTDLTSSHLALPLVAATYVHAHRSMPVGYLSLVNSASFCMAEPTT